MPTILLFLALRHRRDARSYVPEGTPLDALPATIRLQGVIAHMRIDVHLHWPWQARRRARAHAEIDRMTERLVRAVSPQEVK